jgi:hypothetical protein
MLTMQKPVLCILALLGGCAAVGPLSSEPILCTQNEEAAVWQTTLTAEAAHSAQHDFVILENLTAAGLPELRADAVAALLGPNGADVPEELVARFLTANEQPADVGKACKSNRRLRVIPSSEAQEAFRGDNLHARWAAFYKKYDHAAGLFTISRAGFYRDLALVHTTCACGGLCGHGHIFLLRKLDGTWTVLRHSVTWIS